MPLMNLSSAMSNAIRSMQMAQFAMSLHSQNIAHSNDPSYTVRKVNTSLVSDVGGPSIERLRNAFVDQQYRLASASQGEAGARQDILNRVEDLFGDPTSGGLATTLNQFFDSWQGLSENPADDISKIQLISNAKAFVQQIRDIYGGLDELQSTTSDQIAAQVDSVNSALNQIFDLNKNIGETDRAGADDADLKDQRDALLDQLAKSVGAVSTQQPDGSVRITVGGQLVLDQLTVVPLKMVDTANGPTPGWGRDGKVLYNGTGTIGGLLQTRDQDLKDLKDDMVNFAFTIATKVNQLHGPSATAPDGSPAPAKPFFTINTTNDAGGHPIPTADIQVNPDLAISDIIPGFKSAEPADGSRAKAIADLADTPILSSVLLPGETDSPNSFFRNLIGVVGARAGEAKNAQDIADAHVKTSEQQRQSESGVSLDEEMADLMVQQRAFQAATRVITATDDMLNYLITQTGR